MAEKFDSKIIQALSLLEKRIVNLNLDVLFSEKSYDDKGREYYVESAKYHLDGIKVELDYNPSGVFSLTLINKMNEYLGTVTAPTNAIEADSIISTLANFRESIRGTKAKYRDSNAEQLDYLSRRIREVQNQLSSLDQLGIQGKTLVEALEVHLKNVMSDKDELSYEVQKAKDANAKFANSLKELDSSIVNQRIRENNVEKYETRYITVSNKLAEYEKQILSAISSTQEVVNKSDQINGLLKTAEDAVGLNATAGISAAFVKQRNDSKSSLKLWLAGTMFFVFLSGIATVWILTGYGLSNPDSWPSIIGRIVAVGIMVGGATFCSRQYIRQKAIVDDYNYKVVLSQSILAFTDEIRTRSDDSQVIAYLTKVLNEIHKDPQRPRKADMNSAIKMEILDSLADKLNFTKQS